MIRWRGRVPTREQQVANACDDFVNLTPVSDAAAATTKANWSVLLPGQTIPLIGEHRYGDEQEC
jgi:hypothetical protein